MRTLIFFFALGLSPLHALILSGPNGSASGNITETSLDAYISDNSYPSFTYWDNQIQVSDSSGIYLGNSGSYGWVMTAAHVTPLSVNSGSIFVGGNSYTVRASVLIGTADIRLYRIGGDFGDPALPSLPNVVLAASSPSVGTSVLDFGRGSRVEGTANSATNSDIAEAPGTDPNSYEWGSAGNIRWGTNQTSVLPSWLGPPVTTANVISGPYTTNVFFSRFDDAGSGNYLTTTEATFSNGDSGGAAFRLNGSTWELAGINLYVSDDPGSSQNFGDANFYGNVATYRTAIVTAMVPEPGTSVSFLLGASMLLMRRKRTRIGL